MTPTIGRPTLERTIHSVQHQLAPGDEQIVISDGPMPEVAERCARFSWVRYMHTEEQTKNSGSSQRDLAIEHARGTHLTFMDDDDVYTHDAFRTIRARVAAAPALPHFFRMLWGAESHDPGRLTWGEFGVVEYANVGGTICVVPRSPDLPKWADGKPRFGTASGGYDWAWIKELVRLFPAVVFHNHTIALVSPSDEEWLRDLVNVNI